MTYKWGEEGMGIYIIDSHVELNYRLPDHNTDCQGTIRANKECLNYNIIRLIRDLRLRVLTDSQMVIGALTTRAVKSETVLKGEIDVCATYGTIRI